MLISKKYLTEVVGWFEHIEQLADDRKTLNGDAYGKTPNEALQGLYDWCVKHSIL